MHQFLPLSRFVQSVVSYHDGLDLVKRQPIAGAYIVFQKNKLDEPLAKPLNHYRKTITYEYIINVSYLFIVAR